MREACAASVRLRVEVHCRCTAFGDTVVLLGGPPALGAWQPAAALRLDGSGWPTWRGEVDLHRAAGEGALEVKAAIVRASGRVDWEAFDGNRAVCVAADACALGCKLAFVFGYREGHVEQAVAVSLLPPIDLDALSSAGSSPFGSPSSPLLPSPTSSESGGEGPAPEPLALDPPKPRERVGRPLARPASIAVGVLARRLPLPPPPPVPCLGIAGLGLAGLVPACPAGSSRGMPRRTRSMCLPRIAEEREAECAPPDRPPIFATHPLAPHPFLQPLRL